MRSTDIRFVTFFYAKPCLFCWRFIGPLFSAFTAIFRKKPSTARVLLTRSNACSVHSSRNEFLPLPLTIRWRVIHEKLRSWRIDGRVRSVILRQRATLPFFAATYKRNCENIASCCCNLTFYILSKIEFLEISNITQKLFI